MEALAAEGFYDGIIFHRVIPGFMAQTGDPTGTGMGGSGHKPDAECTDYQYIEGTVGMARSMNPDSGDSQFFICSGMWPSNRPICTITGQISRGMDVVRQINAGESRLPNLTTYVPLQLLE